jgi:hypothetical protein
MANETYDDGGIYEATNPRLANALYEEMKPIVAALCSNPMMIDLDSEECPDCQAERLVQMAHSIVTQQKTMHMAMLEEAALRFQKNNKTFDDHLHEAEEDSVSEI